MKHIKPRIFVSQCLGFKACRYNGQCLHNSFVNVLQNHADIITTCPEEAIGLGTPRMPVRLVWEKNEVHLLQPGTDTNLTKKMDTFSKKYVNEIPQLDGAILQHRSPSCGPNSVKIYDKPEKHVKGREGFGMFTKHLLKRFPDLPREDEKRLLNYKIREERLISVRTLARFRFTKETETIHALTEFHAQHKYLLMAKCQMRMRKMGRLLANKENKSLKTITKEYEILLKEALKKETSPKNLQNVLQHILGYFKNEVTTQQKTFFLQSLDMYTESRIPLSTLLRMLRDRAIAFDQSYIQKQILFEPFPYELLELKDSGKKIQI